MRRDCILKNINEGTVENKRGTRRVKLVGR